MIGSSQFKHTIKLTVFFDISKAFDTVNHRKLRFKLALFSTDHLCIAWFKDYLINRTRNVKFKSTLSSHSIHCACGVP